MSQKLILAAAALVVLALGAWLYLQPPAATTPTTKTFSLTVENRRITSGETTLKVQEGDAVSITVTADEEEEFHLHGYDIAVDLTPGTPATLSFTASFTGRFLFELEGSKTELGALEVSP